LKEAPPPSLSLKQCLTGIVIVVGLVILHLKEEFINFDAMISTGLMEERNVVY
jgi:hypothetical protein